LSVLAILCFAPLYFMIVTSFKTDQEFARSLFSFPVGFHFGNYSTAWKAASIGIYMRNSLIVTVGSVALCIAVSVALAFAITFLRWPGRDLVYTLCLVLLAVPPLLLLIPVFKEMADFNLVDSLWGVMLLYAAFTIPFSVYLLVAYMRSLPRTVIEAAVLDGVSVPGLLIRIVVPLSVPAIGTACVFSFIFCWNEFIYAFLLLQSNSVRTLPAGLAGLQGRFFTDFPVLLAATTLSVLPVIGVYIFFQRFLVRGIAVGVS
jgi:raffinose/stachyose/melibiose transport system permease protein